jgi:hypothetical protein
MGNEVVMEVVVVVVVVLTWHPPASPFLIYPLLPLLTAH